MRLKIGLGQGRKAFIAQGLGQGAVVVGQGLGQAGRVGVLVGAQTACSQRAAQQAGGHLAPIAHGGLELGLDLVERRLHANTLRAQARTASSSLSNSPSGGMWSSRSIIVGTARPRCCRVWA